MQLLEDFYKRNLEMKTQWMVDLLDRVGLSHLCNNIIPSPLSGGFRNRAKFRVFYDGYRIRVEGTSPSGGSVDFEKSLWILPHWSRQVVRQIVAFIRKNRRDFVADGFEIQLAHGKKNAHITFSVARSITEFYDGFAGDLLRKTPEITGVAIPSQKLEVGDTFLVHSIGDKDFHAHYASFFQSNLHLTPELVAHVCRTSAELAAPGIFDLFCGVGLMSLSAGDKNIPILGIDINRKAIDSAKINAGCMGFRSANFNVSSVEQFVQSPEIGNDSLLIINPPRSGCSSNVINNIASRSPNHVIIVSCSLKTHVPELAAWKKNGYDAISMKAFEMFPFTDFLETVTVLKRKA